MNPMNLMFSFFFAKSSAEKYNVADTQKLQNTALLAGMVSTNPLLSYLIIENEAKNLGSGVTVTSGTTTTPLPPTGTLTCKYDASSLEKKIKAIVDGSIRENVSSIILAEKDPKVTQLVATISNESFPFYRQQQIETINKIETNFKIIADSPLLQKLGSTDIEVYKSLKEMIVDKGLLNSCKELLSISNSINQLNSYLIVSLALGIESKVSHLKYEIEKLERDSSVFSSSQSTLEPVTEPNPKTSAKQVTKK